MISDIETRTRTRVEIKEPPMFKIIYLNDDKTSIEFVRDTLVEFFDYTSDTAMRITEDIHNQGAATVAVLPYEIAEQKGVEVTMCARDNGYPLQIKLEADVN
jgi:ATP-dependent Clp protease adaptor protein ClpS